MADSGNSDSDSDIPVFKSQRSNIIESDEESSSSSSDGEADKCPICLTRLGQQDLASPNSCLHTFCLNCLTEWAKNAKTCPIDRLEFKFIIVRSVDGKLLQKIDITLKNVCEGLPSSVEDLTYCEVCHMSHREDEMLLCDICDCGYHMDCLDPPIFEVPLEEWYCPQCYAREESSDNDILEIEVIDLINDLNEDEVTSRRSRTRQPQRLVPRTRASERVRLNTQRIQQNIMASEGGIIQSNSSRKKVKKYSKRKTVKRRYKKSKKIVRKKNVPLSERLGVCSSRSSKNNGDNSSLGSSSNFVDHTSLSIFGNRNELDYVSMESEDEHDLGSDGPLHMLTMSRLRISTSDLISRKEISEILRRPIRRNINISHNTDSINILENILNVQEKQLKTKLTDNEKKNFDKYITQTPMYSDHRTDRNTDNVNNYSSNRNNNRNYPRNNDQSYSDMGNSSTYEESQLTNAHNFSENQPVNPFPFRNTGPIKFRMNVTKMGERKQPQTPPKVVTTEYNVEEESGPSTRTEETFKALEPPPEPPALLLGINLDEDDADNLIIDDNDYYDPENVSDNDEEIDTVVKPTGTAYMQSPTYGGYMEQVENRSLPIISVANSNNNILRPEDESISSEDDEKDINVNDDCPNISLYSTASLKMSSSPKEYGPFLEPKDVKINESSGEAELQYIPMPPISPEKDLSSEHGESSTKSEDECSENIVIQDDTKMSTNEDNKDKCENTEISDDDNKSNYDNDCHSDVEQNSKISDTLENEKLLDLIEIEHKDTNEPNDEIGADKENLSLVGGATSEVSCATLNSSDNDVHKEGNNLNFDPISDSEEEKKKTKDQKDKSSSSQKKEKLSNGKNETTITLKGNKDKDKNKLKENEFEKETVPWKKLSKNSKDRNYRYGKGKEKEKNAEENNQKEKKQKRKEIELYDVRRVLEDRPRRKKDKFGRDLSKSSHSDSDSKDRNRRKKRKRSRSKQRRQSISSGRIRNRKRSRSRYRSESKNRHRSKSRHRSRSRHRSKSPKHLSKYDKPQVNTKERHRSSDIHNERDISPLSKRRTKKSNEKTSIYSKIEKDYERKLLKNDQTAKRKIKKKLKDFQYSSLSPRSGSPGLPVWQSPRDHVSPWSHTDISRTPSPVYTRHTTDIDMNYSTRDQEFSEYNDNIALNNLTVIVKNDNTKKSKLSKRHSTRQIAVPPVKEVFASGDNILVSVNFNKDTMTEQTIQEPSKRKRQENAASTLSSKKVKNTNTVAVPDTTSTNQKTSIKRNQNQKWQNRKKISRTIEILNAKPVAIIDLNTSPFREIEMSPKSIIILTDSDEDKQVTKSETKKDISPEKSKENVVVEQKPVEKNENSTQTIPTIMIGGPKTPPEPVNPISKPDNISNNSCEFNSQDEDHTQSHDGRGRGPNTPPEPPRSVDTVVSETAYDPFEPTKSNSPSPPPRIDMFEDEDDDDDDNNHNDTSVQPLEENKTTDSQSSTSPQIVTKVITPPFLESQSSTQTDKSPEKISTNVTNATLFTSPIAAKTPSPVQPPPTVTITDEIINLDDNDDSQTTEFDNGADSPYSPGEGFVDEMKGSSPDSSVPQTKNIVSITSQTQNKNEARSKLDTLLSILPRSKPSNAFDNFSKIKNLKPLKFSSKPKHSKQNIINDDSVDDLPGSAVELESKNKFLEKLNRQERVIEEVKHVLKPHYNKKHITKEQYKDIMRKAVPKICHNKSGEINPQKIHSLIEAYVIKYRHSHRKQVQRISIK